MSPLPEDDDRTVIRPVTRAAVTAPAHTVSEPVDESATVEGDEDTNALPPGTMLGEFEITKKIGEGGFSIVYIAWDQSLDRRVALKEYMPASISARKRHTMVSPRSERHRDTYDAGLKSFINEGKLLAQFEHRSLVKVYRFWEANGTAYMIMPFYEGVTLKDTVLALNQPPDEAWLRQLLEPLTEALRVIHAEQCYHRDIAPDNVMLLQEDGKPLLLDFGAARKVIGDMTQALTVILKPGYAPVEQYAEIPGMKQGPWTDVYALAATVYWAITGKTPPPAVSRMISDHYKPLVECATGRYSEPFLQAIDRALIVRPEQRTPNIDAFRKDLGFDARGNTGNNASPQNPNSEKTIIRPAPPARVKTATADKAVLPRSGSGQTVWWVSGLAISALIGGGVWWGSQANSPKLTPAALPTAALTPKPAQALVPPAPAALPSPVATVQPSPAPVSAPTQASPDIKVEPPPRPHPEPTNTAIAHAAPVKQPKKIVAATAKSENNGAECASIVQRMSLGDASPELISRLKTLHCR
ncbi:MAG: serine/threonine-protein kinase [Pseudomonadota bacterium]